VTDNDPDRDGMPNEWEITHGLNPNSSEGEHGAGGDPDGDRFSNINEFLAGTNPRDGSRYLGLDAIQPGSSGVLLRFQAVGGRSYTVEYTEDLRSGQWTSLADFMPSADGPIKVGDPGSTGSDARYYRIVSPKRD
jgi:hypothetical protein